WIRTALISRRRLCSSVGSWVGFDAGAAATADETARATSSAVMTTPRTDFCTVLQAFRRRGPGGNRLDRKILTGMQARSDSPYVFQTDIWGTTRATRSPCESPTFRRNAS